ncbi:MAG TPA: hypothetical protein DEB62_01720 [Vibrio sp.]|uniref:Uncharacterized protein n=1 Tax=Vibrio casei TaxID=673372 RepID=A0A368LL04_9VIBR|nr:hypothetical protein CIK83_02310 [Vibrio casei]HBV75116.1 hypothetical protein [Vibrio sp.]
MCSLLKINLGEDFIDLNFLPLKSRPFLFEATVLLAAFIHSNRIGKLCSSGFGYLPPHCNVNYFGFNFYFKGRKLTP